MQPAKINYKIYQGSTFQETLRWESQTKTYATISAVSKSAPCVITTTSAHGLPVGWRFRVVGAGGMKEINSVGEDSFYLATATGMSPQAQAAGDSWLDREQTWIDARNQDAATVAPTVRSWAGLASYQAYPILQSLAPNTTPPVPSNLIPTAGTARTAYLNYQAELALIANTIQINQVNSLGYTTYTSGGVVEYNTPVPLTGYTAQMQIRETLESTTVLHELSTGGNGIVINTNDSTIFVTIPAAVTRAFTFDSAVYSLELTNSSGVVIPFASGNLTLVKEVTR
jgi:hypothetical protein